VTAVTDGVLRTSYTLACQSATGSPDCTSAQGPNPSLRVYVYKRLTNPESVTTWVTTAFRSGLRAMNLRCATRLIAVLLLLFACPVRIQTLDDASVSASARSTTQVQGPVQAIRAFPRLNLGSGRDLVYVGMFSSDATFRGSSKVTHFLDAMNAPLPDASRPPVGSAEQAAQQSGAPPWMLSRNSRFINDTAPPEHVRARAEGHSRAGEARDAVVSFVYGQPRLLRAPQTVTSDSQQRVVISDPAIPAVHILDPRRKTLQHSGRARTKAAVARRRGRGW